MICMLVDNLEIKSKVNKKTEICIILRMLMNVHVFLAVCQYIMYASGQSRNQVS